MEEAVAPKRRVDAEHILQVRLKMWVREAVISPHKFFAFDRAGPTGRFTHAREMARGILRSTPDTLLRVKGHVPIWAELKSPRLKLTEERFAKQFPDQAKMGQELLALGDAWCWHDRVKTYATWLQMMKVSLAPNAVFLAEMADATVQSLIESAELKKGVLPKRYKVRAPRPTIGQVRRAERARVLPA